MPDAKAPCFTFAFGPYRTRRDLLLASYGSKLTRSEHRLRDTDLSRLAYVQAARRLTEPELSGNTDAVTGLKGSVERLCAGYPARLAGFCGQYRSTRPVAPLYRMLFCSGSLLVAGLSLAILASLFLAHRMVRPIRTLSDGAAPIGSGDLSQRITIRTGDELEALGSPVS